jgi:hypothetical protein
VHSEFVGIAQFCGCRRIKTCIQDLTALSGQVGLRISDSNGPLAPDVDGRHRSLLRHSSVGYGAPGAAYDRYSRS